MLRPYAGRFLLMPVPFIYKKTNTNTLSNICCFLQALVRVDRKTIWHRRKKPKE